MQFMKGLQTNQYALTRSQDMISSGLKLLRPSDDPSATSRVIALRGRLSNNGAYANAAQDGRGRLDFSSSVLQDSSELLTEIRTLVIQSMNGTLSDEDRKSLGTEISFLRDQLLELGNSQLSGRYVFGGSDTKGKPWNETTVGGVKHVDYSGNMEQQKVSIGEGVDIAINMAGSDIFGKNEASGTTFSGLTGIAGGTTADMGTGIEYITVKHDATIAPGLAALGLALVNGGADDEVLGTQDLVIDAVAGTISIGGGEPIQMPDPADAGAADFVVVNPAGGELHLDFSGYAGAGGSAVVTGEGSVSIDGSNFTPIDFSETNLELRHEGTGSVVHVDLGAVTRSGEELVHFGGAVNIFDDLQGIVDALTNEGGLSSKEVTERLNMGLDELDRNQSNLLGGIGVLGSRSVRLGNTVERLDGQALNLAGAISELRDVDFSEAVLDLTLAEQRLQLVQMSGTRMVKNSLLNFIR